MLAVVLILSAILFFAYRHYSSQRDYWKKRGISGPTPEFLIGNLRRIWLSDQPKSIAISELSKKYGKVFGIHEGRTPVLVVSDLEMTNEILVKKFDHFHARKSESGGANETTKNMLAEASGAHWKRLRALATYAFTTKAMKQILGTVENSASTMVDEIERKASKGEINMHRMFQEYSLDIICRIALGLHDVKMFDNKYAAVCRSVFGHTYTPLDVLGQVHPLLRRVVEKFNLYRGDDAAVAFQGLAVDIATAVMRRKAERESGADATGDFIDMFLDSEVEGKGGDDVTTSNSLSYVTYFLANHPEVQSKCRQEIEDVCHGDTIDYDSLADLKYTEAVVKESLRHYPIASFVVNRICSSPCTIGGHRFEEGDHVLTDTWTLHKDTDIWGKDADEFRPERWFEESSRPRVAFQSFGEGPRMCIGMRLAHLEEKVALVHLLKRFRIEATPRTNPIRLTGSHIVAPERVLVRLVPINAE